MFKGQGSIWLYLVGILILFGILILTGRNFVLPLILRDKDFLKNQSYAYRPTFSINTKLDYLANLNTNLGQIRIDLLEKSTPQNVNNFISLSKNDYYTNTKFHRLIKDLLVQGGDRNTLDDDPNNDGLGKPGYIIEDEINWDSINLTEDQKFKLRDLGYTSTTNLTSSPIQKYSVVMANSAANTNGSQFFIVLADTNDSRLSEMQGKFTVIGKVVSGFDILNTINNIDTDNSNPQAPKPKKDIVIRNVEIFIK